MAVDINFSQARTTKYINKKRSIKLMFKEKDKVYLVCKNIKTKRLSNKLDYKKLRLFKVLEVKSLVNY